MSDTLNIEFAADMPEALVEVVSPSLETVDRIWLGPGREMAVNVPSEESFLRVHLPSGRVVTLRDPGNLKRQVHLADVQEKSTSRMTLPALESLTHSALRIRDVLDIHRDRPWKLSATGGVGTRLESLQADDVNRGGPAKAWDSLPDGTVVHLTSANVTVSPVQPIHPSEVHFSDVRRDTACMLTATGPRGRLVVQLPGMLEDVYVRADEVVGGLRLVSVGVATTSAAADALMMFMTKGDLYSAMGMTTWAESAERLLREKMIDPFAAAAGAYLLLKTRRFDLMRNWAGNLAAYWPGLSDGKIIWAWQLIHQIDPKNESEIRRQLEAAAAGELPIFTEGLNLLRDGLRLLGSSGKSLLEKLNQRVGLVLLDSPLTAGLHDQPKTDALLRTESPRTQFNVSYIASSRPGA